MKKFLSIEWILRLGIFGEFLGHGVFALQHKQGWFVYFESLGISDPSMIGTLLTVVGIIDVALAILVLVRPWRPALIWMAIWGLWTALIRWPIGPDPMWDFFERWANWAAPLALYYVMSEKKSTL